mgnify:CR=1 FL=1
MLRQNQAEKLDLETELGSLSRKVHDLQAQLRQGQGQGQGQQAKQEADSKSSDEDDDILEVSMAGEPLSLTRAGGRGPASSLPASPSVVAPPEVTHSLSFSPFSLRSFLSVCCQSRTSRS